MSSDPPASIEYQSPCDLCGQPASWRSTPKVDEREFTARVIRCVHCQYAYVDPAKAVKRPETRLSALGWLAERIAG